MLRVPQPLPQSLPIKPATILTGDKETFPFGITTGQLPQPLRLIADPPAPPPARPELPRGLNGSLLSAPECGVLQNGVDKHEVPQSCRARNALPTNPQAVNGFLMSDKAKAPAFDPTATEKNGIEATNQWAGHLVQPQHRNQFASRNSFRILIEVGPGQNDQLAANNMADKMRQYFPRAEVQVTHGAAGDFEVTTVAHDGSVSRVHSQRKTKQSPDAGTVLSKLRREEERACAPASSKSSSNYM